MIFLECLTYLALLIQILFCTISIAAGLYYVAELVEEYTNLAKKYIWWMNTTVTILYVLLWVFEIGFPLYLILCGIAAQISHFFILQSFPFVSLSSPIFIIAVVFVITNHYFAFSIFSNSTFTFSEVMAYFTIFLWLVPFALFVSLSANDNVLPTTAERIDADVVSNYFSKRKKYGLLSFFNYAKDSLLPMRTKKGF